MSGAASSYDLSMISYGMGVAILSTLSAFAACRPASYYAGSSSLVFSAITLAYGVMMFASSYIEEEQHFWYWVTSGWLIWLAAKR